ncbi:MAG: lyase family protein, partial [Crocinitomicaceae bacterium]
MNFRIEKDTMGEVNVPADKYWGAQTERSRNNFKIGPEGSMPLEIVHAFAYLKKAAAHANFELGVLNSDKKELISKVCDEILTGMHDQEFPLVVWQTGSGTQSNMNCNEVIANRGHVLTGGSLLDDEKALNPNDDVNKSQSSNDTYPTAMHIAAYKITIENTLPGLKHLRNVLQEKVVAFRDVVKTGRTHFMDATPLTLGQE